MSKHSIDSFIYSASKLLEAYPSTTTLTITYANTHKKNFNRNKAEVDEERNHGDKKAHNLVTFKCYEPNFGECVKYTTFKSKELSRLMTFVGPRGITTTRKKKRSIEENLENNSAKKPKLEIENSKTNGLASIMSNTKFDTEEQQPKVENKMNIEGEHIPSPSTNQTPASSKNKKKKKKGKK